MIILIYVMGLMTPKTNKQRAVNRRSSQNKNPNSSLMGKPTTINWNVNSERAPSFNNVIAQDNKPHLFIQTSSQGTVIQSSTTAITGFGRSFAASDILQFSSFAAVFDQYRIKLIEVWLTPFGSGTVPGYTAAPRFYSVVDYDDSSVSGFSVGLIQSFENCITTRCTDGHYMKFRPHIASVTGGSLSTTPTGLENIPSPWLDCAQTGIPHFGVKAIVDSTNGATDVKIDMVSRIHCEFRNTI
jgi:hypothetical protein